MLVAVDVVLFPKLIGNWIGCCVLIDLNSKWAAAAPVSNKSAKTIADAVEHYILPTLPRVPERLLSDNGTEFTDSIFEDMLNRYNIKHVYSTPYHPSGNGCVERMNRTLAQLLRNIDNSSNCRGNLTKALLVYNNTKHREIGVSPSEYLLARKHEGKDSVIIPNEELTKWRSGHPKFESFRVGDMVLLKVQRRGNCTSYKLNAKYDGPFNISKVFDNGVSYELSDGKNFNKRAHHTQLIAWHKPPLYLHDYYASDVNNLTTDGDTSDDDSSSDFVGFPCLSTTSESESFESDSTMSSIGSAHVGKHKKDKVLRTKGGPHKNVTVNNCLNDSNRFKGFGVTHDGMTDTDDSAPNRFQYSSDNDSLSFKASNPYKVVANQNPINEAILVKIDDSSDDILTDCDKHNTCDLGAIPRLVNRFKDFHKLCTVSDAEPSLGDDTSNVQMLPVPEITITNQVESILDSHNVVLDVVNETWDFSSREPSNNSYDSVDSYIMPDMTDAFIDAQGAIASMVSDISFGTSTAYSSSNNKIDDQGPILVDTSQGVNLEETNSFVGFLSDRSHSFIGFEESNVESGNKQLQLNELLCGKQNQSGESNVNESNGQSEHVASPGICTRSRGDVPDLPNVQNSVLEYKRKKE